MVFQFRWHFQEEKKYVLFKVLIVEWFAAWHSCFAKTRERKKIDILFFRELFEAAPAILVYFLNYRIVKRNIWIFAPHDDRNWMIMHYKNYAIKHLFTNRNMFIPAQMRKLTTGIIFKEVIVLRYKDYEGRYLVRSFNPKKCFIESKAAALIALYRVSQKIAERSIFVKSIFMIVIRQDIVFWKEWYQDHWN